MITVVNKKWFQGKGIYIARPSALGNPYSHKPSSFKDIVKVADATEAVTRYYYWLKREYKKKQAVYEELQRLAAIYRSAGSLTLICWCKQNELDLATPCHGDVVKYAVEKMCEQRGYNKLTHTLPLCLLV